ncbi:MAG: hypothetical protein J5755_04800, partial [Clostridia bacterium]|nr:hypothetical protein [Clostridia bacterium]
MTEKTQNPKTQQAWRIVKLVGNILFYVLIILVIVAGIVGIVGKARGQGKGLGLFGLNFYVVATPSMARVNPEYADFLAGHDDRIQVGDLIVTRRIKQGEQLQVYDVVTFVQGGKIIVHRIVDVQTSANGTVFYTTRGDSNNAADGQRTIDEFTGVLVRNAGHGWGEAVKFVQSYYGIAAVAGVIAIILIAILVNDALKNKQPKPKEPDSLDDPTDDANRHTEQESETNASSVSNPQDPADDANRHPEGSDSGLEGSQGQPPTEGEAPDGDPASSQ